MTIFLKKKFNEYAQVHNTLLRDSTLSWKAKGIGAYLESHQDGYNLSYEFIQGAAKDGRESVQSGVKELKEAGYLEILQIRNEDGTIKYFWIFDSQKLSEEYLSEIKETVYGFTVSGLAVDGQTVDGKSSTKNNNKKNHSKKTITKNTLSKRDEQEKEREDFKKLKSDSQSNEKKFKSFKAFKEFMISNYSGVFETRFKSESGLGYSETTGIKISPTGHLLNMVSGKILEQNEAFKVWQYMFLQQESILHYCAKKN